MPSSDQSEFIADKFAEISNHYKPLLKSDIEIPNLCDSEPAPLFEPHQIHQKIQKMKKKTSTVPGDIDWRIIKEFSVELASPLSNIFNSCTLDGVWPDVWKQEYVMYLYIDETANTSKGSNLTDLSAFSHSRRE